MKHKDGKPATHPDKSSRAVPITLMLFVLCGFSFYLGGIFCSERNRIVVKELTKEVQPQKESISTPLQLKAISFPECSNDYQDYTPCTDPRVYILTYHFIVLENFFFLCLVIRWSVDASFTHLIRLQRQFFPSLSCSSCRWVLGW